MSSSYSVSLIGPSPWGFRLQGGKDFSMPLTISKVSHLASTCNSGLRGTLCIICDGDESVAQELQCASCTLNTKAETLNPRNISLEALRP
ncbi:LIM domain-binding protein 3 [Anabarilius grahami]|uniref:LIM domain-binding protein 3 n=1 Tax=Anabarilius grahami TaxID=495550 RepID=A0A3N0YQ13_ANAGA|nr:LIM domain-binding protein 3 [Anabarilius grahami]